jgi:copper(I)-binding protein
MRLVFAIFLAVGIAAAAIWQFTRSDGTMSIASTSAMLVDGDGPRVFVYANFVNGGTPDILEGVSSAVAQSAFLHVRGDHETVAIPANSSPGLSSDGVYVVLEGLSGDLAEGRLIPVTFRFQQSGELSTQVRIQRPAEQAIAIELPEAQRDPADMPATPRIEISVTAQPDGTYAVLADTWNFVFENPGGNFLESAYCGTGPHSGHGHLYLNGIKLQRMYEPTAIIGQLPPGEYEMVVELNSSLHRALENEQGAVIASQTIVVQ